MWRSRWGEGEEEEQPTTSTHLVGRHLPPLVLLHEPLHEHLAPQLRVGEQVHRLVLAEHLGVVGPHLEEGEQEEGGGGSRRRRGTPSGGGEQEEDV